MDDRRFEVIEGKNDNRDLHEEIVWKRPDTGEKVILLHPTALTATMSERRLRMIAENAKKHPDIEVTYSRFDEEAERMDALREMFKDDEKIIVFDPHDKHR